MTCQLCSQLESERQSRARSLATAISLMNAAATSSDDGGAHMRLRAAAEQATTDLNVLNLKITRHRGQHSVH